MLRVCDQGVPAKLECPTAVDRDPLGETPKCVLHTLMGCDLISLNERSRTDSVSMQNDRLLRADSRSPSVQSFMNLVRPRRLNRSILIRRIYGTGGLG